MDLLARFPNFLYRGEQCHFSSLSRRAYLAKGKILLGSRAKGKTILKNILEQPKKVSLDLVSMLDLRD